jgi:hypothetical protein
LPAAPGESIPGLSRHAFLVFLAFIDSRKR